VRTATLTFEHLSTCLLIPALQTFPLSVSYAACEAPFHLAEYICLSPSTYRIPDLDDDESSAARPALAAADARSLTGAGPEPGARAARPGRECVRMDRQGH
jgi:hypothetical protein